MIEKLNLVGMVTLAISVLCLLTVTLLTSGRM